MAATSICVFNHKHVRCICINANHGSVALFTDPLLCFNDRIHNYNHMFTSCIHIITLSVALESMTRDSPGPLAQKWDSTVQDPCTSTSIPPVRSRTHMLCTCFMDSFFWGRGGVVYVWARGDAVCSGCALQAGQSRGSIPNGVIGIFL